MNQQKNCRDCGRKRIVNQNGFCETCAGNKPPQLSLFEKQYLAEELTELSRRIKANDNARQAER